MRLRRISAAVGATAAAALVVTACAPEQGGTGDENGGAANQSIAVTIGPTEFSSYNGYRSAHYSTYNSGVTDLLQASFYYFDPDGNIQQNSDLGSFELVSDDPMTVEYTIADNAEWSDGTPITVADSILAWGVQNPNLAVDGEPLFQSLNHDLGNDVPAGPEGDPAGKTFTVEFTAPNPDWQIQTWMLHPAHIVAEQSGMTTEELADAIISGDSEALVDAAEFWNTGWDTAPGELPDPELVPSSGPYVLSSWAAGESLTIVANENYYGEAMAPQNDEIVFRFIDQSAMPQALQNGDVDVIAPQPTVDTINQLEELGDAVNVFTRDTLTWEHVDFNFREGTIFGDNPELREAFALCMPRQLIVDNLIVPLNEDAELMNAREVFPFQETYDEVVSAAYDGRYDEVDVDAARALVEGSGVEDTTVRLGYAAPNARRSDQVAMIKSSCDEAGFDIQDAGAEDWFTGPMENGDYDVALFAWAGSGQITSGSNIYKTYENGGGQNYGRYSSEIVDEAWDTLRTTLDEDVHLEQTKIIEEQLWNDLFGLPIFAHPGVDAAAANIENVVQTSTQRGIVWNAYEWHRSE